MIIFSTVSATRRLRRNADNARRAGILCSLALTLALLSCGSPTSPPPPPDSMTVVPDAMYSTWIYWSVTKSLGNGTSQDATITGTLAITRDGRWNMSRDVGGMTTNKTGTFSVDSGRVFLRTDAGASFETYIYYIVTEPFNGSTRKAMTLTTPAIEGATYKYTMREQL